ncbi:MAG: HDOD domain-containing protein [Pirellulaceae bacterium]
MLQTDTQQSLIDLDAVLAAAQLPALPQTAIRLLELSQDASNGPNEFAVPLEADVGLLGQVLKFVNSSYFGFSREISNVKQALALVGVRTIKNFALWSAVFSLVPDPKFGPFDLKNLWQDSLRRAVFSRLLGKVLKLPNAEDLFAAALLQDMAIPLLLKELPAQYEPLIDRRTANEQLRLSQLEREVFGWDHAEAAAALVRNWHLPEEFAVLIERHPNLDELLNASQLDAACVALAALLPSCKDSQWQERGVFMSGLARLSSSMSSASLETLIAEADATFADFAPVMKLPVPDRSLTQWFAE